MDRKWFAAGTASTSLLLFCLLAFFLHFGRSYAAPLESTASEIATGNHSSLGTSPHTSLPGVGINGSVADLSLSMSDAPDPVTAGNQLTYTLTVDNLGPQAAPGVILTNTLPGSVNFVSTSASQGTCAGTSTIGCDLGTIAPGQGATVSIIVVPTTFGVITNTAVLTSTASDPFPTNNTAAETTTVEVFADLALSKIDSADPVLVGEQITYTLTITNFGPSAADGVVVTDTLPAGVTFVSTSTTQGTCVGTASITCTLGTLTGGGNAFVTIVVGTTSAGTFTNTAGVVGAVLDTDPTNNSATESTTVNPAADLSVAKVDSADPITPGQYLTYTITLTNSGPSSALGVVLTDTLPAGLNLISVSPSQGACGGTSTIICSMGNMAPQSNASVSVVVTATAAGTINNSVVVASSVFDPDLSNNVASESTTVSPVANLSVSKTDSADPIFAGDPLTYTITLTNSGPSTAAGVIMTDTLPAGVAFVSASPSQGSCSGTSTVICNLGSLAAQGNASVEVVVTANAAGTINNSVNVASGAFDPDLTNNVASESTTVVPVADLAISKTDSADPILAGDPLTYTIMLTNSGPSAAAGVMLTDTLPTGVTFISASASQGSCSGTTIVVCNLGTLNSAGQASATIVIQTATSGTLNNMAEVASSTFDPNTANNVAVENTTVNPAADLSLALSDSPDPVVVGEPLTYTIIITNNGPSAAAGVTVTDVLPANTTFISATAGQGSCTGTNTVVCNLGMLASGASTTVTIVVVPTTPGVLNNSANVASATSDPAPGNNSATTTTTVLAPPFFMLYMPFVAKS